MAYLKPKEVAEILGITTQTLARWRKEGKSPPFFQNGKTILYDQKRLEEWIEEHSRE